jgi:small-conductance mechanosensitive channel
VADEVRDDERFADKILDEPEVWGVESVGAGRVAIRMVVRTKPADQWGVMRELRRQIKTAFEEAGVQVPQPTWGPPPAGR